MSASVLCLSRGLQGEGVEVDLGAELCCEEQKDLEWVWSLLCPPRILVN